MVMVFFLSIGESYDKGVMEPSYAELFKGSNDLGSPKIQTVRFLRDNVTHEKLRYR
jgi:hypothetical protein